VIILEHMVSYNVGDHEIMAQCGQGRLRCTHVCPDAPRDARAMEQFRVIDHITYRTLCVLIPDTMPRMWEVVAWLP
jgi:hypothetical protein